MIASSSSTIRRRVGRFIQRTLPVPTRRRRKVRAKTPLRFKMFAAGVLYARTIHEVDAPEVERNFHYIVANHRDVLLFLANYATITLHPWSPRLHTLEYPDFVLSTVVSMLRSPHLMISLDFSRS